MNRPPLPAPHAEFEHLTKSDLRLLADQLILEDPLVIDRCIAFICAETRGLWHGRARAMMCRRLKHSELSRSQRTKLVACIIGRLEQGNFSEQFKDQLRLAIKLEPRAALTACHKGTSSLRPHVRRYSAWGISLATVENAA